MSNENVLVANNPHTLGRGKLLIRKEGVTQWTDFAHLSELSVNIATEKLDHFSMRKSLKRRDKSVTTQLTATGSCTVDLPIVENIKNFFLAETVSEVSQSSGALAAATFVLKHNMWAHLGKFKFDPADTFTVTNTAGDTTYVEGTDYEVDRENGLLAPIDGGAITDGQSVKVTCDYLADERRRIDAGEISQLKVHIWFIGDPADGIKQDIKGYANLTPSGDLSFIGDDWQSFQLGIEFIEHSDYAELFEYYDKGVAA